ncbi:MAG: histidinol dehydrogenase [Pseudomonadales bacterium]|jgi:histidinol dehydrogenase
MSDITQLLDASANDFSAKLDRLLSWDSIVDSSVDERVAEILAAVRSDKDAALLKYTNLFDRRDAVVASDLQLTQADLDAALVRISSEERVALETAATRVEQYHQHQLADSWSYTEADGTVLGQRVLPLERVGIYVPGGKAAYPSTVFMCAVPAKVAGVSDIIMTVPTPDGVVNDMVLAAAAIAGVSKVFTVGGAQAIAALAYGTESVPQVDKIVGPGNVYVAAAKRMVFGQVGLDMIAGPSEILIVCDGKTDPDWIAMDLFSQAEHDENAQSILISPDANFLQRVQQSIKKLLPTMERAEIIRESLSNRGALIQVTDLEQAVELVNRIAPEHLELSVDSPEELMAGIHNAGAIFLGRYTSEALGDYCAGPSHVLPTSSTARFSSPLGVYDFQKRTSIIQCSPVGASALGKVASVLARGESLTAHARSAEMRIQKDRS